MAGKNEVIANVRVTVDGVEASKKNLQALTTSAEQLHTRIVDLNKQKIELVTAGNTKKAAEVVEELRKLESSYKTVTQTIKLLEQELGNYENIMEKISGATLQKLNIAARDLTNQMKQQITADDIGKWKQLNDAYKEVMRQIEQLNGKAPNLAYVMKNLGTVSAKSLKDSDAYLKQLIADADQGSSRIIELQNQLKQVQAQQQARLQTAANAAIGNVSGGTFNGSTLQAKEAISTLQQYKDTLNLSTQQAEIERVTQAMNAYNAALGNVQKTAVDVTAVLSNPKMFSTEQIQDAIKQLNEQAKQVKIGDTAQMQQVQQQIEKLQQALVASQNEAQGIDNIVQKAARGEASILEMEKAVAALNDRLKRTPQNQSVEIDKIRQKLDVLNPALEATKKAVVDVKAVLGNIQGSNLGSLKAAAEALEKKMKDVNYQMKDFIHDSAKLKEVNAKIKELEGAWNNTSSQMEKAISRLKNWVLIYAGWSAAVQKVQQATASTLALSDSMADVQKTTGLTADEVARLTDQIQSLDTRVSNEKLMEAATEAGRIGLKTREDVFKFTQSSAVVLTALDELDARAITSVMKLNGLLGETARLGVDNAILSTASSINELSQASSAAAQPIIDFSRRYGGIASQAHISTSQVLALGATLDALGQPVEMSSTAMNKFTTALLANSKQIAEDTGLSEDYVFAMTRQGKTIELMVEVLSKLNSMGGIGEISKYMGDMGGDGARMSAVIAALASNLDFLRSNLDLSNQAFNEGVSVINEYNVKNENAAALVARMGNDIKEAFVNSDAVAAITFLVKGMQQLVHFMTSGQVAARVFNSVLLLIITRLAATSKYVAHINSELKNLGKTFTILFKAFRSGHLGLLQFNLGLQTARIRLIAFKNALKSVFASNPLGWIMLAVDGLMSLVSWLNKTKDTTEDTRSAIERANEKFEEEEYKITKLRKALETARASKKGYADIISTLNRDYGKHLGFLLDEASGYREIAGAIDLATAAQRRQILVEEKNNNSRLVREKYQDSINADIAEVKEGLSETFISASETMLKDLYIAISTDLQASAEKGDASMGKNVAAVLRTMARSAAISQLKRDYGFSDEQIAKQNTSKLEQEYFEKYTNRISKISSIGNLAKQYTQKSAELASLDEEVEVRLTILDQDMQKLQRKQISIIQKESDAFKGKSIADFTEADEKALEKTASLYEEILEKIDPNIDAAKWKETKNKLDETRKIQREVLLSYSENPLKGLKMKVGEDGKLYKEITKDGQVQYEAIQKLSDANLKVLSRAYVRSEQTFQTLMSDQNNLYDSKTREAAKKLSKVKTDIKKELNKNGLDIDDKGNITLRDTEYRDGSARTERQEENEARKAYQALLNNLKEYFDKRQQLVNNSFLSEGITVEQKNRMLDEIEREHLNIRSKMQEELLGGSKNLFDENEYLKGQDPEATAKRLANFERVEQYLKKSNNHLADTVSADMETSNKKIQERLIKHKEEIEKVLLDGQVFAKMSRQYQAQLEKLEIFFMRTEDLGEENFKGMQDRANAIMKMLSEAGAETIDMSYETFRNTVLKYNETSNLLLTTQDEDGQLLLKGTEEDWKTIYQIIMKYNNDIESARVKMFNDNHSMIEKLIEQDELYKNIQQGRTDLDMEKVQTELKEKAGIFSNREGYEKTKSLDMRSLDLEAAEYERRMQLAQEFYDRQIAAAKDNSDQQKLLEQQKREELMNIQTDYDTKTKEQLQAITEKWIEEYNRRAEKAQEFADRIGEFAGVMGAAAWNSVEDRKKAGEELLKYLAQETTEYIKELLIRKIKEMAFNKEAIRMSKQTQEQKANVEQKGADTIGVIQEVAGQAKVGLEQTIGQQVTSIAESAAVSNATTSVKEAGVQTTAGIAAGSAKTVGELGWWGIPLIVVISGLLTALLSTATSALSSAFGTSANTNTNASTKRLATGMLTYAEGRYNVQGNDGQMYDAQYEPTLQTKIYNGGRGKAHFGIFSEKMPEMVVSGPATKIIQQDYPALMDAIITIDKYGRLPNPMPTYARGNVSAFGTTDMAQDENGDYIENPMQAQMMQTLQGVQESIVALNRQLKKGVNSVINMYGKGGLKEKMNEADKFYAKNRIKQ